MKISVIFKSNRYPLLAGLGFVSIIFGSYIFLSVLIAYDVPVSDYWDWIRDLLIPYIDGDINYYQFISGEFIPFAHSHILTLFVFLFDYKYFDLRFDFICLIGLFSTVILYFFMMKKYLESMAEVSDVRFFILSSCALTAILLNPFNISINPLVQFEYVYLLLAIVYLSIYNDFLSGTISPRTFYFFTFIYFYIGDAMGTASILAVITHALFVSTHRKKYMHVIGIFITLACGYLLWKVFFYYISPTITGPNVASKGQAIAYISGHKLNSIIFILNGYSQGLINQHSIVKRIFGNHWHIITLFLGSLIFAFNFFAFCLYYARRRSFPSSLPVLLIIFSAIIIFGILLTRFPLEGPLYSLNDRYQRMSVIGVFGSYWIYSFLYLETDESRIKIAKNKYQPERLFAGGVSIIVLFTAILSHVVKWRNNLPNEIKRMNTIADGIISYSDDPRIELGRYVTYRHCRQGSCEVTVKFLKENKLSVFRSAHEIHKGHNILSEFDANPPRQD